MNPAYIVRRTISIYGVEINPRFFSQGTPTINDIETHPTFESMILITRQMGCHPKINVIISDNSDSISIYIGIYISQIITLPEIIEESYSNYETVHSPQRNAYISRSTEINEDTDLSQYDCFLQEISALIPQEYVVRGVPSLIEFEDEENIEHLNLSNSDNKIDRIFEYLYM